MKQLTIVVLFILVSASSFGIPLSTRTGSVQSEYRAEGVFTIPTPVIDFVPVFRSLAYVSGDVRKQNIDLSVLPEMNAAGTNTTWAALLPGKWRGVFHVRNGVDVPFNFEVVPEGKELYVSFINGEEKFSSGALEVTGDSAYIPLALFDNELAFIANGNQLSGAMRRTDKRGNPVLFDAVKGGNYRFIETGTPPVKDITGKYDVVFTNAAGKEEKAVGIFKQQGNRVRATFLRITGDSRYLDGIIEGNELQLSSFIGSGPAYYKATVQTDGRLRGENINARGALPFVATPDSNAALPDAYALTHLKTGVNRIAFSFPDAQGNKVSASDKRFAGKPLVISIGGTWCPNCMDEAAFLAPWYEKNKSRGIEVVALQYERDTHPANARKSFERFSKRYHIQYPLLLAGVADKQAVIESLPALENFVSFPTTIFVDRRGLVTKIHTGFSGPATGEEYRKFIKEFTETADELINAQ